mgnify:CR=1 FL=1
MKVLVAFGDSYGAGSELYDGTWTSGAQQHPDDYSNFIQLFGEDFDKVLNYSTCAASIPSYIDQLRQFKEDYKKQSEYTVLVMITQHNRDWVHTKKYGWVNLFPNVGKFDEGLKEVEDSWYRTVSYPQTGNMNWYRTIALLQNFFHKYDNITDYYIEQFKQSPKSKNMDFLIDWNKIYEKPIVSEIFHPEQNNDTNTMDWKTFLDTPNYAKYFGTGFHPNELGHKKICERISQILGVKQLKDEDPFIYD